MNSKRDEFLAMAKERSLIRERYKQCIGESIFPAKLSESQFKRDEKDHLKYTLWFPASKQPKPGDGCAIMRADLCIEVKIKSNILEEIRVLVHTMDKMGAGRTFVPTFIDPDDAEFVSRTVESILDVN